MTSSLPRKRSTTELLRLVSSLSLFECLCFSGRWLCRLLSPLVWSGRRGSNPPPIAWKAIALPNELLPPVEVFGISWGRVDSNHRTLPRTDLQSVAIAAMRLPHFDAPSCFSLGHRADEGTRTPDRLITNQLLYQLSYIGFIQPFKQLFFVSNRSAKVQPFSKLAKFFFNFFSLFNLIN